MPIWRVLLLENAYYEQVFENWFKLQNIRQKSSKHSLKILWVNFIKLFNDLVAFTSLHRTYCFTLPTFIPSVSEFMVKNIQKHLFFFWIFLCRNSSLTKITNSCFFLLKKYLIVVNLSHVTLSFNHSIMYICCWRRN